MDQGTISREAMRLGLKVAALLLAYTALGSTGLYQFTSLETEGLNTLIVVVGSIYAVILAFVIFVIWGQFTDVENCVIRECSSLADVVRFSAFLPAEFAAAVRKRVAAYAQHVIKSEWHVLGEGREDKRAEDLFSELITVIMREAQAGTDTPTDKAMYFPNRGDGPQSCRAPG